MAKFENDEVEQSSSCSSSCRRSKDVGKEEFDDVKLPEEPVLDKIINDFMKELQDKTDDPEVNKFLLRTTSI